MVYKSLINNWINVYIGVLEEGISGEKLIQRRIENIDKEATKKLLLWTEDGIFSDVPWDKTADLTECYTRLYDITRAYYVFVKIKVAHLVSKSCAVGTSAK